MIGYAQFMILSLIANDWLRPIYDSFAKLIVKEEVLHADETYYQVLNRMDGRGATSQARIWLIQTGKECETPIGYAQFMILSLSSS